MFSVIIPNYNHAAFLQERIDSILQQTFTNFELIIYDDQSTDNSKEIIEKYRSHAKITKIIYAAENSGSPFSSVKNVLQHTQYDWVWIAESDDIADAKFLDAVSKSIKSRSDIALVYTDTIIKNEINNSDPELFSVQKNHKFKTDKWSKSYETEGQAEVNGVLKWQCTINNVSSVVFNKKLLAESIDQVTTFRLHGDWLLYLLMAKKGKISYIAEPLNIYREHKQNHSKSDITDKLSKTEHFRILQYLLNQNYITEKKKLFQHFAAYYISFGFIKEKGLAKKGLYREYREIDPNLATRVLFRQLVNRITGKNHNK